MKQIVLKPEIKEGDKFIFNGEEVEAYRDCVLSFTFLFRKKDGKTLLNQDGQVVIIDIGYRIIESPDVEHHGYACGEQSSEITEPPIGYCNCGGELETHIADEGTGCFGKCKKCEWDPNKPLEFKKNTKNYAAEKLFKQVAGIDKVIEEKPPLKLRVGGVYKNRKKIKRNIIRRARHTADDSIIYEDDCLYWYRENGKYLQALNEESQFDLIEEVRPEQEQKPTIDEKEAVVNYSFQTNSTPFPDLLTQADNKISEVLAENERLKIALKEKPEGNPFKVGDKIKVYGNCHKRKKDNSSDQPYWFSGFEECEIVDFYSDTYVFFKVIGLINIYQAHYKQCERVE